MTAAGKYRRVTSAAPCPVCRHGDWCRVSTDGGLVLCNREPSNRPARGDGHCWVHQIGQHGKSTESGRLRPPVTTADVTHNKLPPAELVRIDRQCRADLTPRRLTALARTLCVSAASLLRLGIGWHINPQAFTFAMRDASGRIVGIRTRHADGRKRCLTGSALGLVLPAELLPLMAADAPPFYSPDVLLVTEGESDAAAALDLGFAAIGRPGCGTCGGIVVNAVRHLRPGRVVLIADNDTPGRDGADALARKLSAGGIGCRVQLLPDANDLRAWKAKPGNDHHALAALIDAPAETTEGLH